MADRNNLGEYEMRKSTALTSLAVAAALVAIQGTMTQAQGPDKKGGQSPGEQRAEPLQQNRNGGEDAAQKGSSQNDKRSEKGQSEKSGPPNKAAQAERPLADSEKRSKSPEKAAQDKSGQDKSGQEKRAQEKSDKGARGSKDREQADTNAPQDRSSRADREAADKDSGRSKSGDKAAIPANRLGDKDDTKRADDGRTDGSTGSAATKDATKDGAAKDRKASASVPDGVTKEQARQARAKSEPDIRKIRTTVKQDDYPRIRDAFQRAPDQDRARISRADTGVRISIGALLPRRVTLVAVPQDIIAIVPAYREYRYMIVDDEICIVDPETYVIVDVVSRDRARYADGSSGRQSLGGPTTLRLTRDEENVIVESLASDRYEDVTNLGIELNLGLRLPETVKLHAFPDIVVNRIDKLKPYSFAVVEDDILILDRDKREVVYVIDNRPF